MGKREKVVQRKKIIGQIISDKMDKTVVVRVDRLRMHPVYKKRYYLHKNVFAHNPDNKFKQGDRVLIEEIRPNSKKKRFIIRKKDKKR